MVEPREPTVGEYLQQVRFTKGWSLREAAKRVGLAHSRIDEVEKMIDARTGKTFRPSYVNIVKFAKAYGLPPDQLLKRAGYEPGIELTDHEWRLISAFRRMPEAEQADLLVEVERRHPASDL